MNNIVLKLWKLSPQSLYHGVKELLTDDIMIKEVRRIGKIPRFTQDKVKLLGKYITIVDSASFLSMYGEIFERQVIKFSSDRNPTIIDCGSNIGVSVIYFKYLFPESKIISFEADPLIFDILKSNLEQFNYSNIELYQKACSDIDGEEYFLPDGSDGGRVISGLPADKNLIRIDSIRLRPFLEQEIDFLKIDIEGSETRVLLDCEDLLCNVRKMYIEYHSFSSREQTLHTILDILARQKFKVFIESRKYVKPFLESYKENQNPIDMHVYIDAVR